MNGILGKCKFNWCFFVSEILSKQLQKYHAIFATLKYTFFNDLFEHFSSFLTNFFYSVPETMHGTVEYMYITERQVRQCKGQSNSCYMPGGACSKPRWQKFKRNILASCSVYQFSIACFPTIYIALLKFFYSTLEHKVGKVTFWGATRCTKRKL